MAAPDKPSSSKDGEKLAVPPQPVQLPWGGSLPGGYLRRLVTQSPEERFGALRAVDCFSCAATRTGVFGAVAGYLVYNAALHSKSRGHKVMLLALGAGFGTVAVISARDAAAAAARRS
jgi:hypothetical protein